jgi:PHD-finger
MWYVSTSSSYQVNVLIAFQDDGAHSVACEKCNIWQHSKCLGITKAEAEKDDFHFICKDCKQRIEDAKKPKISLKFRTGLSSSPTQPKGEWRPPSQEAIAGVEVPKKRGPGRPPGTARPIPQAFQSNGHAAPYPSLPARSGGSAYFQQPILNGYSAYANSQQSMGRPQHSPYGNGYAQANPVFNFANMASPNGYGVRPSPPSSNSTVYARPTSSHSQYPPYHNGVPYQYQNYSSQSPPSRPTSSHSPNHHPVYNSAAQVVSNTNTPRIPSPALNRPTISPTQGNQDVGPTAGVTQKSPSISYAQPFAQQRTPGMYQSNATSTSYPQTTPASVSRSPNMYHMSGLSPTKHSPVIPPPTHIPQKPSMSPPPHGSSALRSVSGTPIFPPAENLAPSPRQLSKSPVPTPSKNASPIQVGDAELKRINIEAATAMSQLQQAGQ